MKFLLKVFMLLSKYTIRLFIIQTICMNLALARTSNSQDLDNVKVSMSLTNAKIEDVLKKIEQKTEFVFAYSESLTKEVDQSFDLHYSKTSLRKVLEDLSAKANIQFKRIDKTISVAPIKPEDLVKKKRVSMVVTGTVLDDTGIGLPGVNVLEKGTTNGTATDSDGKYSLNVSDPAATLVFTFIGYTTQEVAVNNQTQLNVTLQADTKTLQEVVVIGYQTVDKKDLTGATSVIKPSDANRVTASSLAESIQGLAPGVTVRNSGAPGQAAVIEIRGVSSFKSVNPLYVIDGMIADANPTINTNDIESIQILKDASAAAIYGSRAGNGVVIITTKSGKEGPAKVAFSAKYGIQQMYKKWDVMNNTEFAAMQRTQYENSGQVPPASVAEGTFDPSVNTNWQNETVHNGSLQDYNLSLTGGSKTSSYLISGSYFVNDGYAIGNSFKRGSLRINTRSTRGRVTIGENMVLTNTNGVSPGGGINPMYDMASNLPVIPVQGDQYITPANPGGWGIGTYPDAVTYAWNPVAVRHLSHHTDNYAKVVGNAFADVRIAEWLHYKFNVGLEVSFDHSKDVRKDGVWQYNAANYPSSVNEARSRFLNTLMENTLNFNKTIERHKISAVVGITEQHVSREGISAGRTLLTQANNEYFTTINSAIGASVATGDRSDDYIIRGYLGRLNYSYDERYLLTLTSRIDQDTRFGANYRTGTFPSIGAGWRISRESFFHAPWVSDLKITGSYGRLGFNTLGSWDYISTINNAPRAVFGSTQIPQVGTYTAKIANKNLKWEERTQRNIGLEASLFESRLDFSFAYYDNVAKDALLNLPIAGYYGNLQGDPAVNAGAFSNKGFEIATTYRNNEGAVKWSVSLNATTIKNRVESVGNQPNGDYIQIGNTRSQVGHPIGQWFVVKQDGLFQNQDQIDNYKNADGKIIQPYAKPGDIKFIDRDGNGIIDAQDRQYVGSPWPKLQTGAQFNIGYKQFNLNVQMVGVFGYTIYNDVRRVLDSYQVTNFRSDISPWSETNTNTSDPRIGLADGDQGIVTNNRPDGERWLENASYVRFRNVELGYTVASELAKKLKLNSARAFISGQNLFTITKYKGLDPDVTGASLAERGVDNGHWPSPRVFSVGIQCEF